MNNSVKYITLFLPLMLAFFLQGDPVLSYMTAWIGSFILLYLSLTGFIAPLPTDLPIVQQLMRPVFIIQVIFCGFNFCSSIFFFLDALGMRDYVWTKNYYVDIRKIDKIAEAQRYYLLGHISLLVGMYSRSINLVKQKYRVREDLDWSTFLLGFTVLIFIASFITRFIPGLSQIAEQCRNLFFLSGTYAFCYAIIKKDKSLIFFAGLLYFYSFFSTLISGFKEPVIVSILLVCIFMYPYYRRTILIAGLPLIYVCFFVIPIYVTTFRGLVNDGDVTSLTEARDEAITKTLESKESNWDFLTGRLSEIGMFTTYIESTPKRIPYYGTKLVEQALIVLVPRIAWKDKPVTEELVMQRVFDAGVVSSLAKVSAKPMYIVDGYLSGGLFGIMLSLFLYGYALQWMCGIAESWFGGYFLGTAIMFNGLFPILWRGLSFEFLLNTVLYSFLTLWLFQRLLYTYNFLEKIHDDSPDSAIL